jgi:hypothetical protein
VVFLILSFHFVNKNSCVIYFPHCYFINTLCTHLLYIRSQFPFFTFLLAEDGLGDNNLVVADLGADSPHDFGAYYFLTGFVALPKIEPACHSL